MTSTLVVATRNTGKLREIKHLLSDVGIEVVGLDAFESIGEIVEDGDSFAANARKKAQVVAQATGKPALADDSGLEVEALGGEPGIFSARYAGPDATDADNNSRLLGKLKTVAAPRRAAFRCVMAYCLPSGECNLFEGRLDGLILEQARGAGGFGYDPLFLVPEYGKTLAELAMETKNRISHRGQALRKVAEFLRQ
jgi:XTP/dITP diphosphohydrolase